VKEEHHISLLAPQKRVVGTDLDDLTIVPGFVIREKESLISEIEQALRDALASGPEAKLFVLVQLEQYEGLLCRKRHLSAVEHLSFVAFDINLNDVGPFARALCEMIDARH